ncbi:zinc finger protein ZAT9-like [Durio zibethinus]|uniref:Zinc finger protein ZAT9-like n=1 Tax=Durio zibethinus TaxID=66656 RepID=A0A6P5XL33_DURZI|nr:zinc finger protein ZAT9-like [Durio zibethinus]
MEEVQEFKHVCKFCSKSFPCGRSLGGHMRSHMTNNNNSAETDDKLSKKKLVSVNNVGNDANTETGMEAGINGGYILRENPKKTWRLADSSEANSVHDKVCKECGKRFQSWKALFGHMKCHSEKERASNNSLEEQDSWTSGNQKLVMDSQSDNETAAPSKRRRSERRTRYMGTANSSTFSLTNHVSSSMSEIEQEQEEVALSLVMLSRDVGHWAGLNSVAESSGNNSVFLEAKIEIKASIRNGKETRKLKKQKEKKLESATVDSETFQTGAGQPEFCASGLSKTGVIRVNLVKQTGVDRAQLGSNKLNSSKRKLQESYDPELKSGSVNKLTNDVLDTEFCKDPRKRSKFECTTCNKVFHSYQALGGHRASHKKINGCFASRIDSSENSIETENSPNPTVKSIGNETPIAHLATDTDDKAEMSYGVKKSKGHECPICLKVFPSGQALGGHKRSHLVAEAKENQTIVIQKPIPEIRDFLDLNLPAPVEEETSVHVGFKPWWVGSSHKHEALVGLISN